MIGAHGAAFTNIIFCKPKTKIVEIIPSDHPNKKCKRISKVLNFKYYRIKTKPNNKDKNFPFKISLNKRDQFLFYCVAWVRSDLVRTGATASESLTIQVDARVLIWLFHDQALH